MIVEETAQRAAIEVRSARPTATSVERSVRVAILPTWFVAALGAAFVWCAVAGSLGVVLLKFDHYTPEVVGLVASVCALATAVVVVRRFGHVRAASGPAAIALAIALGFVVLGGAYHSEHLLADRDPAVYIGSARSIAGSHELHPQIRSGAFSDPMYSMKSASVGERADGTLRSNFFPMLPIYLALGWAVGGDSGMLLVPVLLGALGLLGCYALAARLVGPRAALLALLVGAVVPLQLWFARDAYSELAVQVLVLGGLWLYLEARARRDRLIAAIAGGVVACSTLARIDALMIMIGVVLFIGVEAIRAHTPAQRRTVIAFATSFAVVLTLAMYTTIRMSRGYIRTRRDEYALMLVALVLAVTAAVVAWFVDRLRPGVWDRVARSKAVAAIIALTLTGAFVWAYWIRPQSGAVPDKRRAAHAFYFSYSLHWFTEYFGFFAIAAAVIGCWLLWMRARGGNRAATLVLLVAAPSTLLYITRPSITPDQPWAMRRYLPIVLPTIAILVAVVLAAAWNARSQVTRPVARFGVAFGVVVLALLIAVPTAWAARPFLRARQQHGALAAVHRLCHDIGPDGAVLVMPAGLIRLELPQTLRSFCAVPAAVPKRTAEYEVHELADDWASHGRHLFVAASSPHGWARPDDAKLVDHVSVADEEQLERPFDRRPRTRRPRPRDVWLYEIPVAGAASAPQ
jgi:hypothetical protein